MFTQIKKIIKQIIKSTLFKNMIIFLAAIVVTIIIGLKFYNFWAITIGILVGVFVPLVDKIKDIIKYETHSFLEKLPTNIKKYNDILLWNMLWWLNCNYFG